MSFLDNLESSLKNLESQEERDPREHQRRQDERTRAVAVGPWAEQLKMARTHKSFSNKQPLRVTASAPRSTWHGSTICCGSKLESAASNLDPRPRVFSRPLLNPTDYDDPSRESQE